MHNLEFVQEKEKHQILWNFEILKDHEILTKRPEHVIVTKNKRELAEVWTLSSGRPQCKIERS